MNAVFIHSGQFHRMLFGKAQTVLQFIHDRRGVQFSYSLTVQTGLSAFVNEKCSQKCNQAPGSNQQPYDHTDHHTSQIYYMNYTIYCSVPQWMILENVENEKNLAKCKKRTMEFGEFAQCLHRLAPSVQLFLYRYQIAGEMPGKTFVTAGSAVGLLHQQVKPLRSSFFSKILLMKAG